MCPEGYHAITTRTGKSSHSEFREGKSDSLIVKAWECQWIAFPRKNQGQVIRFTQGKTAKHYFHWKSTGIAWQWQDCLPVFSWGWNNSVGSAATEKRKEIRCEKRYHGSRSEQVSSSRHWSFGRTPRYYLWDTDSSAKSWVGGGRGMSGTLELRPTGFEKRWNFSSFSLHRNISGYLWHMTE